MPVAEFPGTRGWGYDGVYISAAQSAYGGPAGLLRLVDAAHAAWARRDPRRRLQPRRRVRREGARGVRPYFTERYQTFWGEALNYDDADCDPVREWVLQSAEGWVRDFHLDGLRLDAIHAIFDQGAAPHHARESRERVTAANPGALVIAESGLNDPKVIRPPEQGGWGHDAQWADDFHHALRDAADRRPRAATTRTSARCGPGEGVRPAVRPRRRLVGVPAAALRRTCRRPPA